MRTRRECAIGISRFDASWWETTVVHAAASATQCRSNPVSGRGLLKTGIFQIFAGDYRRFLPGSGQIWSLETDRQFAKARHWRSFLALLRAESPGTGLPGWRRSADRTCLYENSLVSGNFTGNFAISGLLQPIPEQETAALQHFPEQFPKQINRENISRIREFLRDNRVFPRIVDNPMLVRCATW
jgi:hypothetical protein